MKFFSEIHHENFEECMKRKSCGNCDEPGHHTALCSSGTSVVAKHEVGTINVFSIFPSIPYVHLKANHVLSAGPMSRFLARDKQARKVQEEMIERAKQERDAPWMLVSLLFVINLTLSNLYFLLAQILFSDVKMILTMKKVIQKMIKIKIKSLIHSTATMW